MIVEKLMCFNLLSGVIWGSLVAEQKLDRKMKVSVSFLKFIYTPQVGGI